MPRTATQSQDFLLLSTQHDAQLLSAGFGPAIGPRPYLISMAKRTFDVVMSLILLVWLLPLFVALAVGVKCTSRGPIIFSQWRSGKDLHPFKLLKFRSMYVTNNFLTKQATREDARITHFGRLIRKLSADELPQLINVLKGEMSLVGPRPHPLSLDGHFSSRIPNYALRYMARPGITGLAQVNGARGETPTDSSMEMRVNYDLEYISTASMILDLKILLLTVREVLNSTSAY
jgi:putative colanic acid biosynthesis UDP-glucose lipid carrier transferase